MIAVNSLLVVLCLARSPAQEPAPSETSSGAKPVAARPAEPGISSDAERISSIQNVLNRDEERLERLRSELKQLDDEFEKAQQEFSRLDGQLSQDQKPSADAPPQPDLSDEQRDWIAARDAFDVTIARRKAVAEQIDALDEKIALETEALDRFTSAQPAPAEPPVPRQADGEAPPADSTEDDATTDAATTLLGLSSLVPSATPPKEDEQPKPSATNDAASSSIQSDAVLDTSLAEARQELEEARSQLNAAEARVKQFTRIEQSFERNLAAAQNLLDADRRGLALAEQQLQSATVALAQAPPGDTPERTQLTEQQAAAQQRVTEAQQLVTDHAARLEELQTQLAQIQSLRQSAAEQVDDAQAAVDRAENWVWFYSSPLAPHRVLRWLVLRGPSVLVILLLMVLFWWLSRIVGRRVVSQLALRSRRGDAAEREMRADTLRRVFQSTASVAILAVGALALLNQTGFDVTVLLGGAAVIGAAVAFGSQNLIKDYFAGFMILVENQYSVGNVIKIGDISGTVEDISLRMTVLRDLQGVVHFVPHSQVSTVSNLTHGWSRVVMDVGIAYREDVDRVMEVLMDLARELRDDETFGPKMLGDPEMLGVDALGDSAVVIRFLVKTRPLKQWEVKRELLRRIKNRFDKLGIEIPFPHRTLFHRDLDVRMKSGDESPDDPSSSGVS